MFYLNKLNKFPVVCRVFENTSGVDSDAPELRAIALPISGLPSSGMFVNYFAEDSDASENQLVQLANLELEHSPSDTTSEEWIEPAALVLNSTALLTREHRNVLDAFYLLQVDSSVQVNVAYFEWYSCIAILNLLLGTTKH